MSNIWSDEPPTSPGWYWTRDITPSGRGQTELARLNHRGTWFGETGDEWLPAADLRGICQFILTPIPYPEQFAEMADKAARYDRMMEPTSPATIDGFGEQGFTVTGWGPVPQWPTK